MTNPRRPAARGPEDRERLAVALRQARRAAGLSGAQAGKSAGFGQSKVSKIERMVLLPSPADVDALCRAYKVPAKQREELVQLAEDLHAEQSAKVILARRVGELQHRIGQLEASAVTIRGFQPVMVPGLLQTGAYSRCVFGQPDSQQLDEGQVEAAVGERLGRQTVLDDDSKDVQLIISEGALRWQAGSADLMATQVEGIIRLLDKPNLQLGLIPWTQPVRFFPRHGFSIYDDDAVVVGTETATATMTGTADIATYLELFSALERLAVNGDQARDHLERIAADYRELAAA